MIKGKKWTETEKFRLAIAYEMGAPYKFLCEIVGRSETAINKMLMRMGVRPLGSEKKGRKVGSFLVSLDDVWAEIHRREALLPKQPVADPCPSPSLSPKPFVDKEFDEPWENLTEEKRKFFDFFVTFDQVVSYLEKKGVPVKKDPERSFYVMHKRPVSSTQILMYANKVRYRHGQEPLLVEGLTQF